MATAKEKLIDYGYEDVVVFENPSYDSAIVGVSHDNRAIYDYDKMTESLMTEEDWEEIDAIEWIDYNAIRSIMYTGSVDGMEPPIVMYPIYDDESMQAEKTYDSGYENGYHAALHKIKEFIENELGENKDDA